MQKEKVREITLSLLKNKLEPPVFHLYEEYCAHNEIDLALEFLQYQEAFSGIVHSKDFLIASAIQLFVDGAHILDDIADEDSQRGAHPSFIALVQNKKQLSDREARSLCLHFVFYLDEIAREIFEKHKLGSVYTTIKRKSLKGQIQEEVKEEPAQTIVSNKTSFILLPLLCSATLCSVSLRGADLPTMVCNDQLLDDIVDLCTTKTFLRNNVTSLLHERFSAVHSPSFLSSHHSELQALIGSSLSFKVAFLDSLLTKCKKPEIIKVMQDSLRAYEEECVGMLDRAAQKETQAELL